MTDGCVAGLFTFEECEAVRPGVTAYANARLTFPIDIHPAGTRFETARIDINIGLLTLGMSRKFYYRIVPDIGERISRERVARLYREANEEDDE